MSIVRQPHLLKSLVVVGCVDGALLQSDRAAVGLATSLKCDVSVCCPDNDEVSLRYAIAAGATGMVPLDKAEADIYVIGRGGTGITGELMPARLALAVNATLVLDVLEFELQTEGIRVVRDLGRGSREIMILSLPVVLVISDNAKTPAYISRYRQMRLTND